MSTKPPAEARPIGYIPVFEPRGIATAALITCARCGRPISGMGGPRSGVLCPACVLANHPELASAGAPQTETST